MRYRVALTAMLLCAACAEAPPPAPAPPPPPPPALSEEALTTVERPNVAIIDMNEIPSADHKTVTVVGTLLNRGAAPTREVYVHVEALGASGAVLVSADSEPTTEKIPPGGTARFFVTFENRSDVDRYHIEAVSR